MSKLIHQLATCQDCDWSCDDYENGKARKKAKEHAKKTGHYVIGESAFSWSYKIKQP